MNGGGNGGIKMADSHIDTIEYAVYYNKDDENKRLNIEKLNNCGKNKTIIYIGSKKSCKLYIKRNSSEYDNA